MKLLSSFLKEIKLASTSFYFYVELGFAVILLVIVAFVIPDNFEGAKDKEYLYFEGPKIAEEMMIEDFEDEDGKPVAETIKAGGEEYEATVYESDDKIYYMFETQAEMVAVADGKNAFGAVIRVDDKTFEDTYEHYLQGYETERLKNLLKVIHIEDLEVADEVFDNQDIRQMEKTYVLSDRENILPSLMTFNASLMGFFILAAYVYIDKKQGVIKAYAVTPSPVWQYLVSKTLVVAVTSLITTLLIVVPVMGASINYGLLILFILTTGLFGSGVGLLIAGFYDDMAQSFGVLYTLMIVLGLPIIAFNIPSWDPLWVKFIPSYHIVFGFKEILIPNGNVPYVLWVSLAFVGLGALLLWLSNMRYKRTLSV